MKPLIDPPLAEVIRADTHSIDSAAKSLLCFYEPEGGFFNYLRGTKVVKTAYRGFHHLDSLLYALPSDQKRVGFRPNQDVITRAAPLAFGRVTRVFDLPPRKFQFGRDRRASYRVPFFFIEAGVVKLYYLQPRKGPYLTIDHVEGLATVFKRYLLDLEFFGESTDIEFVDVGAVNAGSARETKIFRLRDVNLWSE
ncbi:MAG: hypothetical protein H0T75_15810, partial [Rhizobiales bacterium]|nr:hypothetical protein [Hyphomicrobiales bacterium]